MTYFSLYYLWSTLGYNTVEYPTIDKQEEEATQEEVTCTNHPPELHVFPEEIEDESSEDDEDSEPLKKKKPVQTETQTPLMTVPYMYPMYSVIKDSDEDITSLIDLLKSLS